MKSNNELELLICEYLTQLSEKYCRQYAVLNKISFNNGVLVTYQALKFLETGSYKDIVIGLNPFIVDRNDGSIFHEKDLLLNSYELIDFFNNSRGYVNRIT